MNKIKNLFSKIKGIKHFYVYCAIGLCLVIVLFYFVSFKKTKNDKEGDISSTEYSSAVEYVDYLENKLSNVLSKISGVGKTSIVVTLESGFSYDYATNKETKKISSSGSETIVTTENVIMVSNAPVIAKENYPNINGEVDVAKGSENTKIKLDILSAIETVLEVDRNNITILA